MADPLIELRAEVARRTENRRIATKHREQAGARVMSGPNAAAYEAALWWEGVQAEQERIARVALHDYLSEAFGLATA